MEHYQVVVVGAGMVGAAAALGLAQQGYKVAVIDQRKPAPFSPQQPMDLRISAISMGSVEILENLGVWHDISAMRACPYRKLATWDLPEYPIEFDCDSLGLAQLGYMVENRVIQIALWDKLMQFPNVSLLCPESIISLVNNDELVDIELESGMKVSCELVLGADGANSKVRQLSHIGITAWDYRQHCMLINVKTELAQQDITWQQFLPTGPRSFLPFIENQASLVWYDSPQRIAQLMAMPIAQLAEEIHHGFPERLGQIEVVDRAAFPLVRRHAQSYVKGRCVLLGDSAHTINPLAGQGVNLGFKDVAEFLDQIDKAGDTSVSACRRYEKNRRPDNLLMQSGMDVFYKVFRTDVKPLQILRSVGLHMLDRADFIKKPVIKYAAGL